MDYELYLKYCEQFGCLISYLRFMGTTMLKDSDGKFYDIGSATDEEVNQLMQESINNGENVLLEKFKEKQCVIELDPNCDY